MNEKELDAVKLARMKRRILLEEKSNLLTHKKTDKEMRELIKRIVIEEERKTY